MNTGVYDAAAICKAIAVDFKVKGLTHETAAGQLGCSKQTVSNQISGKKKFSLKTAQKYAETFGYNLEFLLFGKGELNGFSSGLISVDEVPSVRDSDEMFLLSINFAAVSATIILCLFHTHFIKQIQLSRSFCGIKFIPHSSCSVQFIFVLIFC